MILVVIVSLLNFLWWPLGCRVMVLLHSLIHLLTEFHHCCVKIMLFLLSAIVVTLAAVANSHHSGAGQWGNNKGTTTSKAPPEKCKSCHMTSCRLPSDEGGVVLTSKDIVTVMGRLGLWSNGEGVESWVEGECGECRLVGGATRLLEEKEASMEELGQAFSVFDRNGDGFITPKELWRVMKMLGFEEGARYDDCVSMIRAFDEDGDGRICLSEFKGMLQNAG